MATLTRKPRTSKKTAARETPKPAVTSGPRFTHEAEAPDRGEHTDAVLSDWLGLVGDEVDTLESRGVIARPAEVTEGPL